MNNCTRKSSARCIASRPGYTLIEVLVVLGIAFLVIGLAIPVLSTSRGTAEKISCLANLRDLSQSSHLFAHDNSDLWPSPMKYNKAESAWTVRFREQTYPITHLRSPDSYFMVQNTWHAQLIDFAYAGDPLHESFFCPSDADGTESTERIRAMQNAAPYEQLYAIDRLVSLALHLDARALRDDGPLDNPEFLRTTRVDDTRFPSAKAALFESTARHTPEPGASRRALTLASLSSHTVLAVDGSAALRSRADATAPVMFTNSEQGIWEPGIPDAERLLVRAWDTTRDGVEGRDW